MIRNASVLWAIGIAVIGQSVSGQSVIERTRDRFPAYDPDFTLREIEEAKVPAHHANRPRLRTIPPPKSKPPDAAETMPAESRVSPADEEVIELPEVTVETDALPDAGLARPVVAPSVKAVTPEPFLTAEAKTELMIEKHHSLLDRFFLNRFAIFGSNKARAAEAEQREQFARAMHTIADGIEQGSTWGLTEEELKELKKQYYELLNAAPK